MDRHDLIRQRAHAIWESEGRPENRSEEHWKMASAEIEAAGAAPPQRSAEDETPLIEVGSKPAKAAKARSNKAGQTSAAKSESSAIDPPPLSEGALKVSKPKRAASPVSADAGEAAKSSPKRAAKKLPKG